MELINYLRTAMTVIAFVTFMGILLWAWSGGRKQAFAEAAQLPFTGDDDVTSNERSAL